MKLENAVSAVVDWRLNTVMIDSWRTFHTIEYAITTEFMSDFPTVARSCVCWMTELAKIDKRLTVYFTCLVFLVVAGKIGRGGLQDNLLKILAATVDHFIPSSNDFSERVLSLLDKTARVVHQCQQSAANKPDMNTSELVELLQQSAVERLTIFRQIVARDFSSVVTIVTTDFEALYAYKRGDYQQCLQLSTQNVRTLLYAVRMPAVYTFPVFIPLLDDDIVSLTALTVLVSPKCRDGTCRDGNCSRSTKITQLTLSLYLMTQCQLKLRHSVMSLAQTLEYIEVAQRRHPIDLTLNRLTLKLTERKVKTYITV